MGCLAGDPLYSQVLTGSLVPAHAGNDQEQQGGAGEMSGRALTGKPVRGRRFCPDPLALLPRSWPDTRLPTGPGAGRPAGFAPARVPFLLIR